MRFATIAALSSIVLAGFSAACTSDSDCPRGQTCQFIGIKDSQGQCYKRGEGPAAARRKSGRKRSIVDHDAVRMIAREVVQAELDARGFLDELVEL